MDIYILVISDFQTKQNKKAYNNNNTIIANLKHYILKMCMFKKREFTLKFFHINVSKNICH